MKILITGGSGLLGQYLNIQLSKKNKIFTLYNTNEGNCRSFNSARIDLTQYNELKEIFSSFNPDIVIHTAAISRPEICDQLPRNTVISINVTSTKYIAVLCEMTSAKLIFTSTDLIYDGNQGQMLSEESRINPVSFYAQTKLESEEQIRSTFENYVILRTSLLYGLGLNHSLNHFHVMYYNFLQKKKARLFYDQFRTPLSLPDAAELIDHMVECDFSGIMLNFGGPQRLSRVELGEILCDIGKFDKTLIEEISVHDVPQLHNVYDVSMSTNKLQSLGLRQKPVHEAVAEAIRNHF